MLCHSPQHLIEVIFDSARSVAREHKHGDGLVDRRCRPLLAFDRDRRTAGYSALGWRYCLQGLLLDESLQLLVGLALLPQHRLKSLNTVLQASRPCNLFVETLSKRLQCNGD